MIRIAICDDDIQMTTQIEKLLQDISRKKRLRIETEIFFSGEGLYSYIARGNSFDVIYLDIEMENGDGIETAQKLRESKNQVLIVYISMYEEYCKLLFDVEPVGFILKPIDKERFSVIFERIYEKLLKGINYFLFQYKWSTYKVATEDILYFESEARVLHVRLYTGESYQFYGKLDEVEEEMERRSIPFLRIHKSFLVNFNHVKKLHNTVVLSDGTELQFSKMKRRLINGKYMKTLKKEMTH